MPSTPVLYTSLPTGSPDSDTSPDSPAYLRPPLHRSSSKLSPRRFIPRPSTVLALFLLFLTFSVPLAFTRHPRLQPYTYSLFPSLTGLAPRNPATGGIPADLRVPFTLEARLSYLLSRPALAQWEAELPSRHACPMYTYSRNTYFFHDGKPEQWERIGAPEIRRYRSKMVDYLRGVEREGGKLVWEESMERDVPVEQRRGIITTGGGGKELERLRLALHMLRKVVHTALPIEIYHFPDEMQDPVLRKELEDEYDVQLRQVGGKRPNGKSWNIKNAAFLSTRFTEFVYMDSDNIPLADPAELFESVEYKQSGSVFWPDLNKDHPDNAIFRVTGRYCSDDHWPAEAGQIVFDKRGNNGLNLAVLHLSNHMMDNEDMYGFLSYGDKDTFRFSFYALGLDYQQAPKMFASAGGYQTENGESSPNFCGHSMVQWGLTPLKHAHNPDYHPAPAFLHTILAKHRHGLQPAKLFTHIRRPRLDDINEPLLVRTLYEWTGDCFAITVKGPDGLHGADGSMGDGQGAYEQGLDEVLAQGGRAHVWDELQALSEAFVAINMD